MACVPIHAFPVDNRGVVENHGGRDRPYNPFPPFPNSPTKELSLLLAVGVRCRFLSYI